MFSPCLFYYLNSTLSAIVSRGTNVLPFLGDVDGKVFLAISIVLWIS